MWPETVLSRSRVRAPTVRPPSVSRNEAMSMIREAGGTSVERCAHERSHILDSKFHSGGYATAASRRVFCDVCRLDRWLRVEAAFALSQAELGIIPESAAREIDRVASIVAFDLDAVACGIARTGHSIMPLLSALKDACSDQAREFVHFGATTQDIQDTAQSLEMRDVLDEAEAQLLGLRHVLRVLAHVHRGTVMVARTHSIPALPTTFGLKVAGWLDELSRHQDRLAESRERVLVAQLFGGVGTMAALGAKALPLLDVFAKRLGLSSPKIGWHVARDRVAEFVTVLAMLTATLGRIADEIRALNRPELAELEIPWGPHQIGSSTMPHKRNPEQCEQVVALARLARAHAGLALESMIVDHERDYRGTRIEWVTVADVSHFTLTALELITDVITGLKVNSQVMLDNAHRFSEAVCTEALVFMLGNVLGKDSAFRLIHELSQRSQNERVPLRDLLLSDPRVRDTGVSREALERCFDPSAYVGQAAVLVDRVIRNSFPADHEAHDEVGGQRPVVATNRQPRLVLQT
jgi:adenylosuccinate lyase